MTETISCDICKKEIPFGAAYISIVYNIEQLERDHIEQIDTIQIISSDEVFIMCGQCGNKFHAEATQSLLKTGFSNKNPRLN